LGAKIGGVKQNQVQQELEANAINPDTPTDEECEQVEMTVQDWYLAVIFLLNCNKNRYGVLVHDMLKNDYI
jgi:hypothetical protein